MVIDRFGGSEALWRADVPIPIVGEGDVLIRAAYASVNPADWKGRAGLLPHLHHYAFPITMGMDCSGIVESVGSAVTQYRPGDRVITLSGFGLGYQGTYAEYVSAPQQRVVHIPSNLTFAQAATVPIAAASAASSILDVAKVRADDLVLVNGGAGSVGTFAIQFLRSLGARVIATCSTRNLDHVRALGAERVIDYTRDDISAALIDWAPDGLDSVIDAVGQHSLPADLPRLIRSGGTLVCITNLLTGVEAFDLAMATKRDVRVVDNVTDAMTDDPRDFQVAAFRRLVAAIADGVIDVPPYEVVPLEAVASAHDRVQDGHVRGKILLEIAPL